MVSSAASLPCDLLQAPYTSLLEALEKKKEYLLKRVEKLNKLNDDAKTGTVLTEVQDEARKKLPEVEAQVDYLKRLGKQIKENQRDFNKQRRQRDLAQTTKVSEDHLSNVVDTLVARHVLEEYRRNVGGKGYSDSFTAEERSRLEYLGTIFVPKIDNSSELRQLMQKNAAIIAAIQRQDSNITVSEGFTAIDAHHLLTILIGLVEQADLKVSDIEVEDTEVEALAPHLPASIMVKNKVNVDIQVLPEEVIEPDTVHFGYSSEDDVASKETKDSPMTTTANAASSPEQDLRSLESDSLPPCGSPDNTSCTENSGECTTPDEALPPSASVEVSSAEEEPSKVDPAHKEQVNDVAPAPAPAKDDKAEQAEKDGANRPRNGRRRGNNQRRESGAPRDGQKKFNKANGNRSHGQNENANVHPRDGAVKNGKSNGYRGGNAGNGHHNARSNGHFNDRSNGNFSDRSNGNSNGNASNGYKNGGYTNNYDNTGYIRRGGYVRPPPGTCGFILQVNN